MRDHAVLAFDVRGRGDDGGRNLAGGVVRHRSPQDTPTRRVGWTQKPRQPIIYAWPCCSAALVFGPSPLVAFLTEVPKRAPCRVVVPLDPLIFSKSLQQGKPPQLREHVIAATAQFSTLLSSM